MYSTQPGVQFYTGNFLDGTLRGKKGAVYPKHSGFCLETQNWPDAVNQVKLQPGFSSGVVSKVTLDDRGPDTRVFMIQKSMGVLFSQS